jgi:hypothetical protein
MDKENVLQNLINAFSNSEIKAFLLFIQADFLNVRTDVQRMLQLLSEKKQPEPISKQQLYAQIYAKKPFDEKQMRYLQSWALKTVYQFLTWQALQADAPQMQLYRSRALRKKGQIALFDREIRNAFTEIETFPFRDLHYFQHKSKLLQEKTKSGELTDRAGELSLPALTEHINIALMAETLRHACTLLSHKALSSQEVEFPLLVPVLDLMQNSATLGQYPLLKVYYLIYQSQTMTENTPYFYDLKTLIQTQENVFPDAEIRDIYLFAINFCIKKINTGEKIFIKEALEMYKVGLEKGFLIENGILSQYAYNNIMLIALGAGETTWVEVFLEKFKGALPQKNRETVYQFNLATYYFRTNKLDAAMDLLSTTEFQDTLQKLDAQRMLIRIYYEKGEFQALDSLLDTFRTYLYRNTKIGYHRNNYLNLIKIVKKMLQIDIKNALERKKLIVEINKTPMLAEREWILKKLKI